MTDPQDNTMLTFRQSATLLALAGAVILSGCYGTYYGSHEHDQGGPSIDYCPSRLPAAQSRLESMYTRIDGRRSAYMEASVKTRDGVDVDVEVSTDSGGNIVRHSASTGLSDIYVDCGSSGSKNTCFVDIYLDGNEVISMGPTTEGRVPLRCVVAGKRWIRIEHAGKIIYETDVVIDSDTEYEVDIVEVAPGDFQVDVRRRGRLADRIPNPPGTARADRGDHDHDRDHDHRRDDDDNWGNRDDDRHHDDRHRDDRERRADRDEGDDWSSRDDDRDRDDDDDQWSNRGSDDRDRRDDRERRANRDRDDDDQWNSRNLDASDVDRDRRRNPELGDSIDERRADRDRDDDDEWSSRDDDDRDRRADRDGDDDDQWNSRNPDASDVARDRRRKPDVGSGVDERRTNERDSDDDRRARRRVDPADKRRRAKGPNNPRVDDSDDDDNSRSSGDNPSLNVPDRRRVKSPGGVKVGDDSSSSAKKVDKRRKASKRRANAGGDDSSRRQVDRRVSPKVDRKTVNVPDNDNRSQDREVKGEVKAGRGLVVNDSGSSNKRRAKKVNPGSRMVTSKSPMSDSEFRELVERVRRESRQRLRHGLMRDAIRRGNYFRSQQVAILIDFLTKASLKIDAAEHFYPRVVNKSKFDQVLDKFDRAKDRREVEERLGLD